MRQEAHELADDEVTERRAVLRVLDCRVGEHTVEREGADKTILLRAGQGGCFVGRTLPVADGVRAASRESQIVSSTKTRCSGKIRFELSKSTKARRRASYRSEAVGCSLLRQEPSVSDSLSTVIGLTDGPAVSRSSLSATSCADKSGSASTMATRCSCLRGVTLRGRPVDLPASNEPVESKRFCHRARVVGSILYSAAVSCKLPDNARWSTARLRRSSESGPGF